MDADALRRAFARTYSPPRDLDPVELQADYNRFVEYRAEHSNAGRHKTANAVGIPASRARSWIDGSKPDVVRGTEIADQHGWFATSGDQHRTLTRLVAGIFAAGSINKTWTPRWSAADEEPFAEYLSEIGVRANRINRQSEQQGDEIEPANHARILGRVLVARGAPRTHVSDYEIPEYLFDDETAGKAFAETYMRSRGVCPEGRRHVQIYEHNRSESYYDNLHRLFEQYADADTSRAENGVLIHLPRDAILNLKQEALEIWIE